MKKIDPIKLIKSEADKHGSIPKLAAHIGVTDVYLYLVVNGKREPAATLCEYFGITKHTDTWYTKS